MIDFLVRIGVADVFVAGRKYNHVRRHSDELSRSSSLRQDADNLIGSFLVEVQIKRQAF